MCKADTISLALYNPKRESGRMTIGFLHSFTNDFCAGAELLLAWSVQNPLKVDNLAIAGRQVRSIEISLMFTNREEKILWKHSPQKKTSVHKNSAVPFPYLRYQLQRNCTLNVVRRKIKTFFLRWFVSNSLCSIPLILSYVCRYSFQKSSLALTVSKDALDLSVWHQPNDSWQIGGSFIFDKPTSKAVGSFCYQLEMKDTLIKGMIDSDWSVGCTYNRWGELFISLISVLVSMAFN